MLRDKLNEETISESQQLAILKELYNMTMTAPLLNATQIGKALTHLKNTNDGRVGEIARRMKNDWNWIILDHEKQEAISKAVDQAMDKVVEEVQLRLGQAVGNGPLPLPVPSQPTFETSTTASSKKSIDERRYLLTKFEFSMLDDKGRQKQSFEKLYQEKKYFEVEDPLYRSWLHLKLNAVGTEKEAFDAIIRKRTIKNIPKRKNKRAMNEPEGIDRHMPQSEAWKDKLKEIEEKKKKKDMTKKKKEVNINKNKDNNSSNIKKKDNRNDKKKDNNNKNNENDHSNSSKINSNNENNNSNNINNENDKSNNKNNENINSNKNKSNINATTTTRTKTEMPTARIKKRNLVQVSDVNKGKDEIDDAPINKRLRKKSVQFTS